MEFCRKGRDDIMTHKKKNLKGFTLAELIMVIMILGALAALLIPTMMNYVKKARIRAAIADARTVMTSVESSLVDHLVNNDGDSSPAFNKVLYLDQETGKNFRDRDYEIVGAFTNLSWNIYKSGSGGSYSGSQGVDLVIATALDHTFSEKWDAGKRVNPMSYNSDSKNCKQYLKDNKTNFGLVVVYNTTGSVRMMQLYRNGILVTYVGGTYVVNSSSKAHFVGTGTWDTIYKDSDENKTAPEEFCKVNLSNKQINGTGGLGGWY